MLRFWEVGGPRLRWGAVWYSKGQGESYWEFECYLLWCIRYLRNKSSQLHKVILTLMPEAKVQSSGVVPFDLQTDHYDNHPLVRKHVRTRATCQRASSAAEVDLEYSFMPDSCRTADPVLWDGLAYSYAFSLTHWYHRAQPQLAKRYQESDWTRPETLPHQFTGPVRTGGPLGGACE